ncbi:carbonic anhydrase [Maridesulfovibrio frigidus]|uniref:carbonic anhydrase n=1 Tax=Maridesulfovibrio frigidus TaxID=340956 RepID=UPI0004E13BAC|nr:carbonic anhydrase [Maridesulfovibrio frigidus]
MKAINKLINGFSRFRDEYYCREDSPFVELQNHQEPSTMVIACSDSRTDPSLILQCEPGEIFVVRNIANIVPPYEPDSMHHGVSSALEYAVKSLKVKNIIILGHSGCGGIKALMDNKLAPEDEFITRWLSILGSVRDKVIARFALDGKKASVEACAACEMEGIVHSMDNLMTFTWVAEQVEKGDLEIFGWYFDLKDGRILDYHEDSEAFEPLRPFCLS